jgi:hypothetical protein
MCIPSSIHISFSLLSRAVFALQKIFLKILGFCSLFEAFSSETGGARICTPPLSLLFLG